MRLVRALPRGTLVRGPEDPSKGNASCLTPAPGVACSAGGAVSAVASPCSRKGYPILSALQSHMRRAAANGRVLEQVGPFLATFSPESGNPFLNYAIPDDGAHPSA